MLYIGRASKNSYIMKKVLRYQKNLKIDHDSYYARHPRYMSDDTCAGYFEKEAELTTFGWQTSGGNMTTVTIDECHVTITLDGARQGLDFPSFLRDENIVWETVQYKTWEPSWSPWESIRDHRECINMADYDPYEYSLETEEYLYRLERSFFAA